MPLSKPDIPNPRKPCELPVPDSTKSFWHSEPSPLLLGHRTTRNLPESADVVVIGSGMTGTSIAYHLVESSVACNKPLKVVLLEAREACWGATGRNGGHCQPLLFTHPKDPSIGHFELANFHTLQDLIKEKSIDCEFVAQPGVQALYDDHHVNTVKASLEIMKGNAPELLERMKLVTSPEELASLRVPTAKAAVVTDIAARMWPYKFVSRILEDLLDNHPETFNLQTLTPVTKITPSDSDVRIETSRGTISAKKVILATNAYTPHLLPQFAPLIVPVRGQMSTLRPFPSVSGPEKRLKTSLGFASSGEEDYLIQRPDERGGHLMFGGGRSHGGRTVGTTDDSIVDPDTEKYLRGRLGTVLGLPESGQAMDAVNMWTGIMGFSRDEKPWVGEVDGKGVFVAAGFTGHGMPNTWLSGKAAAELVRRDLDGKGGQEAVDAVCELGLPRSYIFSEDRVKAALEQWEDVEAQDWAEIARGRMAKGDN